MKKVLKRHYRKFLLIYILFAIFVVAAAFSGKYTNTSKAREAAIRGRVVSVDPKEKIKVVYAGKEVTVIYGGRKCKNEKITEVGKTIQVGDDVEIFGKQYNEGTVSTCDSEKYFIRKI